MQEVIGVGAVLALVYVWFVDGFRRISLIFSEKLENVKEYKIYDASVRGRVMQMLFIEGYLRRSTFTV